jgi:Xaa-Pro aminopeptidase
VARKIKVELEKRNLHKEPVGVDVVEPPILFALQKEGLTIVDGQQLMSDAREIKTVDEISLLTHSAAMVDAAYYDLYRAMKPGMRENDAVALVAQRLYEMGRSTSRASTRTRRTREPAPARLLGSHDAPG